MAGDQISCQVSVVYCILQAACRFKRPVIRQAAIRWLRQNNRAPSGDLLIRLKFAELEELCSNYDDWFKQIDRIIDLYDFLAPKDPQQTSFTSPWFYFRNVIIVGAAVQGYDDECCIESCTKKLLQMPAADSTTGDYANKQTHMQKLAKELSLYNGVRETSVLQTKFPLIYQFLKNNPDAKLMAFLGIFRTALDPDYCFLEAAAEQVRASKPNDSTIELSSESQRLGYKLLLEQFQDYARSLGESITNLDENVEVSADDSEQPKNAPTCVASVKHISESRLHAQSESEFELKHDKRKRKRSVDGSTPAQRFDEDRHREGSRSARKGSKMSRSETLEQFKLKLRSLHRAAERVPDARERANAAARKIQEALAQGRYERWSDNEVEDGYSDSGNDRLRTESRSASPRPVHRHTLPKQDRHHTPASSRRMSLSLAAVPSPRHDGRNVRRSVGPWQEYEIEELRYGVSNFGVGQWTQILKHGRFMAGRTSVDLKDKYRNMVRRGRFLA